jgi:hypothetical protein
MRRSIMAGRRAQIESERRVRDREKAAALASRATEKTQVMTNITAK